MLRRNLIFRSDRTSINSGSVRPTLIKSVIFITIFMRPATSEGGRHIVRQHPECKNYANQSFRIENGEIYLG